MCLSCMPPFDILPTSTTAKTNSKDVNCKKGKSEDDES